MNSEFNSRVKYTANLLFHYIGLSLAVVATFWLSLLISEGKQQESSLVEFAQEALLLINVLMIGRLAKAKPEWRAFCALFGGFMACLLIRELDFYFDFISHGFWFYPCLVVFIVSVSYTAKHWDQFKPAFVRFSYSTQFLQICGALILLLFYSRLVGMSELWKFVMQDGYVRSVKSFAEEGLELGAYVMLSYAIFRFVKNKLTSD